MGWAVGVAVVLGLAGANACNDEQTTTDTVVSDTGTADTAASQDLIPHDTVVDDSAGAETVPSETVASDSAEGDTVPSDTTANDSVANDSVANDSVANDSVANDSVASDTSGDVSETTIAACGAGDDCTLCAYGTAPKTVADCYCAICPYAPMTSEACQANADAWGTVCGDWSPGPAGCPMAMCIRPKPVACIDGQCQSACSGAVCPALACPEAEQTILPGDCCPSCTGDTRCDGSEELHCENCLYPTAPTSAADCYCTVCADAPLPASVCLANDKAWHKFCDPWPKPDACPVPRCALRTEPVCDRYGQCVPDPNGCRLPEDCASCDIGGPPPENPSECRCPMCPGPLAKAECEAVHEAMSLVCADFDYASCPIPPCAAPPPVTCRADTMTCGYDFSGSP